VRWHDEELELRIVSLWQELVRQHDGLELEGNANCISSRSWCARTRIGIGGERELFSRAGASKKETRNLRETGETRIVSPAQELMRWHEFEKLESEGPANCISWGVGAPA